MTFPKFLALAAIGGLASPAVAGTMVIGGTAASACYEAAEAKGVPSRSALDDCDQALTHDMLTNYEVVATHVNRGIIRLRRGDLEAAIADFDTAIAKDPNEAEAYLNKGMAALRLPDGWTQALPLFDTAIAKETRKPAVAYYGRAIANELAGEVRAAYRDYQQASRLAPEWREPKAELARFTVGRR